MNPMNSTPYGSRNRYGVATPLVRIRLRDLRPARAGWLRAAGSSREVAVTSSAELLLVRGQNGGGLLGRAVQGVGRALLAQDGGLVAVVQLLGRVADTGDRRREVHVGDVLGEGLEVAQALREVGALRQL